MISVGGRSGLAGGGESRPPPPDFRRHQAPLKVPPRLPLESIPGEQWVMRRQASRRQSDGAAEKSVHQPVNRSRPQTRKPVRRQGKIDHQPDGIGRRQAGKMLYASGQRRGREAVEEEAGDNGIKAIGCPPREGIGDFPVNPPRELTRAFHPQPGHGRAGLDTGQLSRRMALQAGLGKTAMAFTHTQDAPASFQLIQPVHPRPLKPVPGGQRFQRVVARCQSSEVHRECQINPATQPPTA